MSHRLAAFAIAAAVVAADRVTKVWIEAHISAWDAHTVIPGFFQIVHTQNRGAAFGLFAESSSEWRGLILVALSMVVLVFIAGMLWRLPQHRVDGQPNLRVALSLVLGGALGNLHDRVARGGVTDFLDFYLGSYHWPAFNVADSAITIGALLLALDLWRSRHPSGQH